MNLFYKFPPLKEVNVHFIITPLQHSVDVRGKTCFPQLKNEETDVHWSSVV